MGTAHTMAPIARNGGLLYPMLVIAAIAMIVFSVAGVATLMGWMPSALSANNAEDIAGAGEAQPAGDPRDRAGLATVAFAGEPGARESTLAASDWGVIESVRTIQVLGESDWLGAAGGAVGGGILGHQIGASGSAGDLHQSVRYLVRVRLDDGTHRTYIETTQPEWAIGQKVRTTDQSIVAAG